jgi:hypothetical protein
MWKRIDDLIIKTLIVVEGKINTGLSSIAINLGTYSNQILSAMVIAIFFRFVF